MIEQEITLLTNGRISFQKCGNGLQFGYSKNRGVYSIKVRTSGEWNGLTIRAFWHVPDGKDPASSLVVDGYVDVPASVTAQPGSGCVTFEGSDGTKTVTSADLRYRVSANSGTEDGTEPEPGTPAWQELVGVVKGYSDTAVEAKESAKKSADEAKQALEDTKDVKSQAIEEINSVKEDAKGELKTLCDSTRDFANQAKEAADRAKASEDASKKNADDSATTLQELKDGIASGNFKGEKGDKGDPGPQGPQGEPGPDNLVIITATANATVQGEYIPDTTYSNALADIQANKAVMIKLDNVPGRYYIPYSSSNAEILASAGTVSGSNQSIELYLIKWTAQTNTITLTGTKKGCIADGGTAGQVLVKKSDDSFDTEWQTTLITYENNATSITFDEAQKAIQKGCVLLLNKETGLTYVLNKQFEYIRGFNFIAYDNNILQGLFVTWISNNISFYAAYETVNKVPSGGTSGQVLTKKSDSNYDIEWKDVETGKTVSVNVGTTTTSEAGTNATVTNSGDETNVVLNFTIPRGEQGPAGPQGPKGDPGPAVALDTTLTHEGEAADAKATGDAIQGVSDDIVAEAARAKEAENQLKEDIGNLNKVSEKISSVSIIQKCEVSDGYYWNFIAGGKETKEINDNYIAVKIPVEGNKLIVYGEFQDWASRYVNNGAYTSVESTYISHNTQTSKVAEFYNIPTDAKYLCLSFYKGGLDTSIESVNVVSGEFRQYLSYRKTDFVNSVDVYTKDEIDDKLGEIHINKIYVATTGNDTEGNGTKEKPYATVLKANDVVTNASEKNKYEIIVADGTYTDLQEKYKGQNGSDYQGVIAKSYVTYKSESNNPEKCIFIWDGGVGYDTISNDTCTNKCFFHINSVTINTVIKGFKFVGSNLRYCLHFESNCLTTPYIENCIFDWHGRDFAPKNGPVIGMGGSIFSHITFKDCKFLNSQNDAGIQWHDNTYPYDWINGRYEPEGLCPKGAVIECIDCLFDGLNVQVRSQNEDRPMPCCLILKNCGGLKNVYPSIIAGGTKNYWKLFNQCSFIKNDLLTDATETTTYDEMTSIKTSTN